MGQQTHTVILEKKYNPEILFIVLLNVRKYFVISNNVTKVQDGM
jgi:hypothetical protein